mmetsp:Transcript_30811/g.71123  ORF Transcript_30811/g.71123 Transcript_30811/m.71123 type:complete len:268 (+) Transcript_30811:612-1415(+)
MQVSVHEVVFQAHLCHHVDEEMVNPVTLIVQLRVVFGVVHIVRQRYAFGFSHNEDCVSAGIDWRNKHVPVPAEVEVETSHMLGLDGEVDLLTHVRLEVFNRLDQSHPLQIRLPPCYQTGQGCQKTQIYIQLLLDASAAKLHNYIGAIILGSVDLRYASSAHEVGFLHLQARNHLACLSNILLRHRRWHVFVQLGHSIAYLFGNDVSPRGRPLSELDEDRAGMLEGGDHRPRSKRVVGRSCRKPNNEQVHTAPKDGEVRKESDEHQNQ